MINLKLYIMKNLIILSGIILFVISCNTQNEFLVNIPQIDVAKGVLPGGIEVNQANLIIKDYDNWMLLLDFMKYHENESGVANDFIETEIDFTEYMVLAVIDREWGVSGFSIEITEINEYENSIDIIVERYGEPGDIPVVNQPFHIVKIPIQSKKIVFK